MLYLDTTPCDELRRAHWLANNALHGRDSKRRATKSSLIGKQCITWTRLHATSYEELIYWQTMLYLDSTRSDELRRAHWLASNALLGNQSMWRATKSSLLSKQCFTWTRLQATSYEEFIDWQTMLYLATTPCDELRTAHWLANNALLRHDSKRRATKRSFIGKQSFTSTRPQPTSYEELIQWQTLLYLDTTSSDELRSARWLANNALLGHDSKGRAAKSSWIGKHWLLGHDFKWWSTKSSLIGKQCFTWTRLQQTSYEELIDRETMLYLKTTPIDELRIADWLSNNALLRHDSTRRATKSSFIGKQCFTWTRLETTSYEELID